MSASRSSAFPCRTVRCGHGLLVLVSLFAMGCDHLPAKPAAKNLPARPMPTTLPSPPPRPAVVPPIDSPAFETTTAAAKAWHAAYRQDGLAGHRQITFCQNEFADDPARIQAILDERFSIIRAAEKLEELLTIASGHDAAVIVRGGEQVSYICMHRDAAGWHVSRTLIDLSVMSGAIGQEMKARMELATMAHAKAGRFASGRDPSLPTAAAGGKIDSPAFDSPEAAVRAWWRAYQEEGEAGHKRLTFDETNTQPEQWKSTLAQRFQEAVQQAEPEIVETIEDAPLAAVIVRLGAEYPAFCLFRDEYGWHLSRTLVDWNTVAGVGNYSKDSQLATRIRDFGIGVGIKASELERRE